MVIDSCVTRDASERGMMKFRLALAFLLPLATPALAQNPGVALRWDACFGDGAGVQIQTFACDTNAGGERLVGSFVAPEDRTGVTGLEMVVDLFTYLPAADGPAAGPALPEWWKFKNAAYCRSTALTVTFASNPSSLMCQDWASTPPLGGIAAYVVGILGPASARIIMAEAVPSASPGEIHAATEYAAFTLLLSHRNTIGSGGCSGCEVPMVIVLNSLKVTFPASPGQPTTDFTLSGPVNGTDSHIVFWQGVPSPVPARATTWRAVKALYR